MRRFILILATPVFIVIALMAYGGFHLADGVRRLTDSSDG